MVQKAQDVGRAGCVGSSVRIAVDADAPRPTGVGITQSRCHICGARERAALDTPGILRFSVAIDLHADLGADQREHAIVRCSPLARPRTPGRGVSCYRSWRQNSRACHNSRAVVPPRAPFAWASAARYARGTLFHTSCNDFACPDVQPALHPPFDVGYELR
jgi:hypothetical protein